MADWTSGYVADIGYIYGYYSELNPLRAKFMLLSARLALPAMGTACELGFGQGVSVNMHAAGGTVDWHGTDFNPSQAGSAQQLAASYADGATLHDQSFAEFCARPDLPDFDYIALHGIWSWISDENRAVIVDFVRRKLKVSGVLYISYNTLPGWTAMVPVRHLLTRHAEIMTAPGAGPAAKVESAVAFARKLWATNPAYARAHPRLGERLTTIAGQDHHYVAHEYFNRDWVPMSFADMARWLESAKLDFACSATAIEHVPETQMTPEQLALLTELPDPTFRQSVRDFMVNQQFRRDYWVKGPRQLNLLAYTEELREQRVILTARREDITLTLDCALGKTTLAEPIYTPLLDLLADHQPRTLGQLEKALRGVGITLGHLQQATLVLLEKGVLGLAQDDATIARCRPRTDSLNRTLIAQARGSADVNFLASPVLGGGVAVSRFHQLFLLARAGDMHMPHEWALFTDRLLKAQQQRVLKDGVPLEDDAAMLRHLKEQADIFNEKRLPVLIALGIA
ncbi:class I SAM-dependent methyltransferase [Duganella sp. PWIR1]